MAELNPKLANRVLHPPASVGELAETEKRLGMRLPPLVRRVYAEVGNGGFGPGYGLWGLITGHQDDRDSVVSRYELYTGPAPEGDENWRWPRSRIVLAHWGCAICSCLDLAFEPAPVLRFDPGRFVARGAAEHGAVPSESLDPCFAPEADSFGEWLRAWLDGRVKFELSGA